MGEGKGTGLANHPGVVFISIVASILGIATFITGRHNLSDFLALRRTAGRNNQVSSDSAATDPVVPYRQPGLSSPSTPQAVSEDLESSDFSSWRVDSFGSHLENVRWQLLSNEGRPIIEAIGGTEFGGGNSVAYMPTVNIADGTVSGWVKVESVFNGGHHSGLVARYKDVSNFYELYFNKPSKGVLLNCWLDGQEMHLGLATLPETWFGSWIKLKLVLSGTELKAYANDRLLFVTNDEAHSAGSMGLVNMGGITRFNGFNFTRLRSEHAPNSVPAPDG